MCAVPIVLPEAGAGVAVGYGEFPPPRLVAAAWKSISTHCLHCMELLSAVCGLEWLSNGCWALQCFAAFPRVGRAVLSNPWGLQLYFLHCNWCREGCCAAFGRSQWHSLIKQTSCDSFCHRLFVSFFFLPAKHPRHFQPLAQRSESRRAPSPTHEWTAGFALLCKHNVGPL